MRGDERFRSVGLKDLVKNLTSGVHVRTGPGGGEK